MSINNGNLPEDTGDEFGAIFDEIQDAGVSEEMQAAEQQGTRAKISLQHKAVEKDSERMECYGEEDLVERARLLASLQVIKFPHYKPTKDDFVLQADRTSDMNRYAVFDALFDKGSGVVPFPHKDTFRGRLVDHRGETFTDRTLEVTEIVAAVDAAGLSNPNSRQVAQSYKEWALRYQRDDLMDFFYKKLPEWDGTARIEKYLIELFRPFDTELNRQIGVYFWLSLYNRLTNPGCQAPISIALIGGQNAGKSYFSKLLCEAIMNDRHATPIPLNLAAQNFNPFLRAITGRSIIANVGEMTGFKKADIENMKAFLTKTEDDLDFKFEDTQVKPRQWIAIMDGNEYAGMQRDDTGNRRVYPIFVGQLADKDGQPNWSKDFQADLSTLKEDVWQLMAECAAWMEKHGEAGYNAFVGETSRMLTEFSKNEMERARGVIRDEMVDNDLVEVVITAPYDRHHSGRWHITSGAIAMGFRAKCGKSPFSRTLAPHMSKLGFEPATYRNQRGYFTPLIKNEAGEYISDLMTILAYLIRDESDPEDIEFLKKVIERKRSLGRDKDEF
ncbi:hypothetical protein O157vBn_00076 [Escherichia phage vB_Eco4M-7n]|nr:DNA primase [Escherichia phage vB_Eco4M-7]